MGILESRGSLGRADGQVGVGWRGRAVNPDSPGNRERVGNLVSVDGQVGLD